MEVDHDRALSLITSAADGGLLDAFDKLVSMYQNGIGVARDYQRAAEWLGKKTALLEESYAEEADEETAALLLVSALRHGPEVDFAVADSPFADIVNVLEGKAPALLVKLAMEVGTDVVPNMSGDAGNMLKDIDMNKVIEMVEKGLIGKIVEVESAQGDTVEIVVE